MLGAIAGDIIGSIYEWDRIKTKDFPLFRDGVFFTDDSVCTVAIPDCILQGGDFARFLKDYGRRYPGRD
jgi:ADP-ribosylglycohydrolase